MVGYSLSITQVLNQWAAEGVFSYLFPFLIIFAMVFAILQKTKLFGDPTAADNKKSNINGINAIIAVSVAFIALLNDYVATFFASIFPKFGIALAIFLVLLILVGFFYVPATGKEYSGALKFIGWALGIGVVLWAWSDWGDMFGSSWGLTYFFDQYFWGLVLLAGIAGLIYWVVNGEPAPGNTGIPKV